MTNPKLEPQPMDPWIALTIWAGVIIATSVSILIAQWLTGRC